MFKFTLFKIRASKKLIRFCSSYVNNSISISHLFEAKNVGDSVTVQGWVKSMRKMKENTFFDLNDGSSDKKLQVLIAPNFKPDDLSTGASIIVSGSLKPTPKGGLELHADFLKVCGKCAIADGYPFAPRKSYAAEYIRQYLHLRPRTNKFSSLLRIRNGVQKAFVDHLHQEGYIQIHTPILTSNDCEDAGEVFTVHPESKELLKSMVKSDVELEEAYFDKKVFLTVSAQLHLEAVAHGLSKVFSFGPTFRAENSRSRLHLSEFYMLEIEKAFTTKIEDIIEVTEALVKNTTEVIQNNYGDDIKIFENEHNIDLSWAHRKFPILSFGEAVSIINKNEKEFSVKFVEENGFSKEHELFLVKYCGGTPVFVINWPKNTKPFYMKECEDDDTKVAAFDLLAPNIGELVGGSLRENDYGKISEKVSNNNLDWYLDLRRFGSVPTGGFGLGFERYLQLLLGVNNIKDTIPFPRWSHNCNL